MKLALGTVQFGLAYGVAGRSEPVAAPEVRRILGMASECGVRILDTADAYGDIEGRLADLCGELPFDIVSKISAIPPALNEHDAAGWALSCAQRSFDRLGIRLKTLMLHRADDLRGQRGRRIWDALSRWAAERDIALGASCYDPAECLDLHTELGIAVAQLPGNAFDQRIQTTAAEAGPWPELHLRSAFLQGLLLMPKDEAVARLPAAGAPLRHWHQWLARQACTPIQGALAVVKGFAQVSACVVGVDSLQHFEEVADAWASARAVDARELTCDVRAVIDPRSWNQKQ